MQIFISYSRKDIDFARKLAEDLEKAGYDVWWDLTDLRGGDDWPRVIPAAIDASERVIIVLSPNSAASDWVEKEYTHALSMRKKIIPIMLQVCNVPFALNTINYVDFTSPEKYVPSFNNLLTALGHTGERPVVTPPATLPGLFRKYAIPIGIGILILLGILSAIFFSPPPPGETPTPSSLPTTTPVGIFTETVTVSPTITLTATSTPTATEAPTATTESPTPTPTRARAFSLPICVYYPSVSGVHVRKSPSTGAGSDPLSKALEADGSDCPFFNTRIENEAREIWFQVAAAESQKEEFKPYAGGWVYSDLLVVVDRRWGILPICVYNRSVGTVYIRDASSESDFNRIGNPLEADGSNCLFFSSPIEDEAKNIWFQVAPSGYQTEQFKQYAGGWIPAEWLAIVDTKRLPAVTLTPSATPSNTPTITATFTRTPSEVPSNTPTRTPTDVPTDSPTPTDTAIPPTETPTSQ